MKILLVLLVLVASAAAEKKVPAPVKIGAAEKVKLPDTELIFHAKMAPSFRKSYLHATDVSFKKGKLKFKLSDRYGNSKEFDVESKEKSIVFQFCLADRLVPATVELVNRENREEELMLGRSALAGEVLINPAVTYTLDPSCE